VLAIGNHLDASDNRWSRCIEPRLVMGPLSPNIWYKLGFKPKLCIWIGGLEPEGSADRISSKGPSESNAICSQGNIWYCKSLNCAYKLSQTALPMDVAVVLTIYKKPSTIHRKQVTTKSHLSAHSSHIYMNKGLSPNKRYKTAQGIISKQRYIDLCPRDLFAHSIRYRSIAYVC